MKKIALVVAALGIMGAAGQAEAAGCLKGAAVGGVAGHVAGGHAGLGAAAGCAVGHHEAAKTQRQNANVTANGSGGAPTDSTSH